VKSTKNKNQPNIGSTAANIEKPSEQTQSSNTSGNGSKKMPGFKQPLVSSMCLAYSCIKKGKKAGYLKTQTISTIG